MNLRSSRALMARRVRVVRAASRRLMDRAHGPEPRKQRAKGSCEDIDGS